MSSRMILIRRGLIVAPHHVSESRGDEIVARRVRVPNSPKASVETLEGRVLLSAGVSSKVHALVAEMRAAHPHRAPTMGVVGDSLSDEYRFYPPNRSQARNWVELLGAKHVLNFGAYTLRSRGEPRDAGFAFNWAECATTSDMVANQLPGLLPQVQSGRVQMVTVLIGDDDFGNFLQQAPALASDPQALMAKLTEVTATAEANFDGSVNAILGANPNVKVVVGTIFDITKTPAVEGPLAAFGPGAATSASDQPGDLGV